ncbi:MAG: DNA repair protein [Phycisphaeraceae bacterium]|nr:DNA repair protein [Phycisphaeraceae bacterium]
MKRLPLLLLGFALLTLTGCNTMYYTMSESLFGVQKREILVDRVEDARDEQTEAKEQFQTTLEKFKSVVGFDGGELETLYKELKAEYERCDSQAKDVKSRISSIENVANAMFDEWETELGQYTSATLRRASEQQLSATKARYQQMLAAMITAQQKMQPVLNAFHDQVLFLKHNLNAQAITSLQTTVGSLQSDVDRLIKEMETSIDQANRFISELKTD